ncbi:MAG: hypothetical protein ACTSPI_10300 [Candidatus Heimdallarchaeaceae archaeon]
MFCKNCNKEVGYYISGTIQGQATQYYGKDGSIKEDESNIDWDWEDYVCYCTECDNELEEV